MKETFLKTILILFTTSVWMSMLATSIQTRTIPTDPELLRELVGELMNLLQTKDKRIGNLETYIHQLQRHRFGKRSETVDEGQMLLGLIQELVPEALPKEWTQEPEKPKTKRKGHGRTKIPDHIPRDVYTYDLPDREKRCSHCKKAMVRIGEDVLEQWEYVPASYRAKKQVRIKWGCPTNDCIGEIKTPDLPPQPVEKCKAASGMLAHVAISTYMYHLPKHRLEEMMRNEGAEIPRSTIWEWDKGAADAVFPLYNAIRTDVQSADLIMGDETPVRYKDQETKMMKKGYQWAYLGHGHIVYEFSPDRKLEHSAHFLQNSSGYFLSDAYGGFCSVCRSSQGKLKHCLCWAHLRRKFFDAMESDRERGLVGIAYIKALYRVDDEAECWTPNKRRKLRKRKSKPILDRMKAWMEEQGMVVLSGSPMARAFSYALKNWEKFNRFLEDGRIRLDNNLSENALRQFAVGRNNWGRYESVDGGRVAAILTTLMANCRRYKVNPFEYLKDVLDRIATHPHRKILQLSPKYWKPKTKPPLRPDTS